MVIQIIYFGDLVWSDPDEVDTWALNNSRGCGFLFGNKVIKEV